MEELRRYDQILSGIIDAQVLVEADQARLNTIKRAQDTCKENEYILTLQTIRDRIGLSALWNFTYVYLEGRRHSLELDSLYIKVKMLGGDTGFIELHSAITGECLEWKYCEGISETESVRP